jgi:hypothetical protein
MGKRRTMRWLGLGLTWLAVGCSGQDAEHLAEVGRRLGANLDSATGGTRGKFVDGLEAARTSWQAPTLDGRVSARLRWDRNLAGAQITVDSPAPGEVRLRGTVVDLNQRRRVVDLVGSTFGVEKVVDELIEK